MDGDTPELEYIIFEPQFHTNLIWLDVGPQDQEKVVPVVSTTKWSEQSKPLLREPLSTRPLVVESGVAYRIAMSPPDACKSVPLHEIPVPDVHELLRGQRGAMPTFGGGRDGAGDGEGGGGSGGDGGDGDFPGQKPTSPLKTPPLALQSAQYAPKPAMSCV